MAASGKTTAQLIEENDRLQRLVAELRAGDAVRNQAEEELHERTKQLGERVKKLHFLHRLAGITQVPGVSLEEILQRIVELLPTGWQYPDITCARITLDGIEFKTESFRETPYRHAADIVIHGALAGAVEVFYLEETSEADEGPFLNVERRLLEAVAGRIRHAAEHMHALEALQESEEKYRRLFESLNDAALVADTESGIILDANARAESLLGRAYAEIIGMHQSALHPSEEAERYQAAFAKYVRAGRAADYDGEVVRKDGTVVPVAISVSMMEQGGKRVILGLFRDITQRVKAQEELQDILKRLDEFRNIVNRSPAVVFVWRAIPGKWAVKYVSDNVRQVLGYAADDLFSGRVPWLDIIHPEDGARLEAEAAEYPEQGRMEWAQEYRLTTKSGEVRWFSAQNLALRDPSGNIARVQSIMLDVTDRKEAEKVLRSALGNLEEFRDVVDRTPAVLFVWRVTDGVWPVESVSHNVRRVVRYTADDFLSGRVKWPPGGDPEEMQRLRAEMYRYLEEGREEWVQEYRIVTGRGEARWVNEQSVALRDSSGKTTRVQSIILDVTDRKKAEGALRESEARFRDLVETTSDWVWEVDENAGYTYSNPRVRELLGYEPEEVLGKTPFDLMSAEDASRVAGIFGTIAALREPFQALENTNLRKDGHPIVLESSGIPLFDEDGTFRGYRGIDRDITERKRAERERTAYDERLRSLVTQLGKAEERARWEVADRLHDSVGPLLTISTMRLHNLKKSATSAKLAADLEDIGRLLAEAAKGLRAVTYELRPAILIELGLSRAVAAFVEEFGRLHDIPVEVEDCGHPESLDKDSRALAYRAVRELLFNVVKHARATEARVCIGREPDFVRIEVKDDGVGFDASGELTGADAEGAFGLFSIREHLHHIGGRLEIESSHGRGTKVTILVPANTEMQPMEGNGS